jgi:hypothetical protein
MSSNHYEVLNTRLPWNPSLDPVRIVVGIESTAALQARVSCTHSSAAEVPR